MFIVKTIHEGRVQKLSKPFKTKEEAEVFLKMKHIKLKYPKAFIDESSSN